MTWPWPWAEDTSRLLRSRGWHVSPWVLLNRHFVFSRAPVLDELMGTGVQLQASAIPSQSHALSLPYFVPHTWRAGAAGPLEAASPHLPGICRHPNNWVCRGRMTSLGSCQATRQGREGGQAGLKQGAVTGLEAPRPAQMSGWLRKARCAACGLPEGPATEHLVSAVFGERLGG